jgi:gag-polypeptide of LTR copia-type
MATNLSSVATMLSQVTKLTKGEWYKWKKQVGMCFLAADLEGIESGDKTKDVDELKKWNQTDKKLTGFLYMTVEKDYQYLVEDERTASGMYQKLKEHFERTSMASRINARLALYSVSHDTSLPITAYFHALDSAKSELKSLGVDISESEFKDILLMHLDDSFNNLRVTLLARETEPSLPTIKDVLISSSSSSSDVKIEGAFSARSNRSRDPDPVDDKGFRWCDPTASGVCHRCGRTGHPAARCMYNMPQHVKDWLMSRPSRRTSSPSSSSAPPSRARANIAQDPSPPLCPNCGLDLTHEHARFAHTSSTSFEYALAAHAIPDSDDEDSDGEIGLGGGSDSDLEYDDVEIPAHLFPSLPRI